MAITQLTGKQIKDQSIDLTTDVTGVLPTANGGTPQYILLQDQVSSGSAGGFFSAHTWLTCPLNTIAHDDTGSVILSSNLFTLPSGTYEVNANIQATTDDGSQNMRVRLFNSTDSTVILYGQSVMTGRAGQASPNVIGKFTLTSSKTLNLSLYASDIVRLGTASSISGVPEIYTQVELRKVS
jgi:hypothetical protein